MSLTQPDGTDRATGLTVNSSFGRGAAIRGVVRTSVDSVVVTDVEAGVAGTHLVGDGVVGTTVMGSGVYGRSLGTGVGVAGLSGHRNAVSSKLTS